MKLSWKIFYLAYIIVLLCTGLGGFFLIKNVTDTIWQERIQRLETSENYAIDSFISLSLQTVEELNESRFRSMKQQISNILDSCVSSLEIIKTDSSQYPDLAENEGYIRFLQNNDSYLADLSCLVTINEQVYLITVRSDFSEVQRYCLRIWNIYRFSILVIAVISGSLLLFSIYKITNPIKQLSRAANEIASGSYGKTIDVKNNTLEIKELNDSFNNMSLAVSEALDTVNTQIKKREAFIPNFAHETKTPVTVIMGYADMLRSYELEEAEARKSADIIYKEGRRLENLSIQLLDLFVAENEEIKMTRVSLKDMEKTLRENLFFSAQKYQVQFSVNLPDQLIIGNRTLLLSLFYNLADNAFKASGQGDSVHIFASVHKDKIRIYVEDQGRGIPAEHMDWITEPFYREDKVRSRKENSAGLGLTLCKTIAEIHSASLDFYSEVGKGTTVVFELSLYREEL